MPSLPDKHNHQIPTVGANKSRTVQALIACTVRGNVLGQGTQWSTRHRICSFLFTKETNKKNPNCLLLYPSSLESSFKIKNNS